VREGTVEPRPHRLAIAALVPRPRSHIIPFHGLFAPNARHHRLVVPAPAPAPVCEGAGQGAMPSRAQMTWAQRLRRVFDIDVGRRSGDVDVMGGLPALERCGV